MPPIVWTSLIADEYGVIDYARLSRFVSVLLAVAAGIIVIVGAVLELGFRVQLPSEHANTATWVMLAPITAGKVSDAIAGLLARKKNGATKDSNNA